MDLLQIGVIGIAVMVILLFSGMPVAVAMFLIASVGLYVVTGNLTGTLNMLVTGAFRMTAVFTFTVVPMFTLMGHFASMGKISEELYDIATKWLGRVPGGLAMATTLAGAGFAAVCGSSMASCATFGKISLPAMLQRGYDKRLAAGCIASAGTLAIMIPPSGLMVVYGIFTETSIGPLLIAGIIPGLISAAMFMMTTFIQVKHRPDIAPVAQYHFTWGERFASLKGSLALMVLVMLVLGTMYAGVLTPTEAAAMGAFGALVIAVVRRTMKRADFTRAVAESATTTGMIFFIIIGAVLFGRFLAVTQLPQTVQAWIAGAQVAPILIVIAFMFMYVILGTFLEGLAMLALTLPVVFPIVTQSLGFSPIWLGVLIVKVCELGQMTPPFAMVLFTLHAVAKEHVSLHDIFMGILPYVIADIFTLGLLVSFPSLSLYLPGLMPQ